MDPTEAEKLYVNGADWKRF